MEVRMSNELDELKTRLRADRAFAELTVAQQGDNLRSGRAYLPPRLPTRLERPIMFSRPWTPLQ
jgi:hypothetical protein